jgi:hypothetical protein
VRNLRHELSDRNFVLEDESRCVTMHPHIERVRTADQVTQESTLE